MTLEDADSGRWRDYAERWGTDQYDEGFWTPRRTAVLYYVALALMVLSLPIRVWVMLIELGLVD